MTIIVCTGKLHRVRVTQARLDYEGSITIDSELMRAGCISTARSPDVAPDRPQPVAIRLL